MKNNQHFLGVEIGGTKIQLFVGDEGLNIVAKSVFGVGDKKEAAQVLSRIEEETSKLMQDHTILATGMGFGGPVDFRTGKVHQSFQVSGWTGMPLADWMTEITGTPVFVDNDANLAALAEANLGAGQGFSRLFYTTLGSGVGGGFVIDRELYHGQAPGEVEFGHLRLDKTGRTVESSCSGWALNRKLKDYIGGNPGAPLAGLVKKHREDPTKLLIKAIGYGDDGAKAILEDTTNDLAFGLSHVVHLFNPDILVLGGGLSLLGESLLIPLAERLPHYLMAPMKKQMPSVACARLGQDVVPLGALLLAGNQIKKTQTFEG
ncbi:MAG: ROK family protein [Cyclobacteriaceae bacterium]|nr:ROK family protein [Cyclobacteriaceae bacterium]